MGQFQFRARFVKTKQLQFTNGKFYYCLSTSLLIPKNNISALFESLELCHWYLISNCTCVFYDWTLRVWDCVQLVVVLIWFLKIISIISNLITFYMCGFWGRGDFCLGSEKKWKFSRSIVFYFIEFKKDGWFFLGRWKEG